MHKILLKTVCFLRARAGGERKEGRKGGGGERRFFFKKKCLPPLQSALDVKLELAIRVFCCLKVSFMF